MALRYEGSKRAAETVAKTHKADPWFTRQGLVFCILFVGAYLLACLIAETGGDALVRRLGW